MKCCVRCGRWGSRAFREVNSSDMAPGGNEGWICSNDRACFTRVARQPHVHLAPTICDC